MNGLAQPTHPQFPEHAEKLFKENEEAAMARYDHLVRLSEALRSREEEQPEGKATCS